MLKKLDEMKMQFESSSLNHPFLFSGLKISFRPEKSSQSWKKFCCSKCWAEKSFRWHSFAFRSGFDYITKWNVSADILFYFLQLNKLCWWFLFLLRLRNAHSLRKLFVKIWDFIASVLLIFSTEIYQLKKKSNAINISRNIFDKNYGTSSKVWPS